MIKAYFLITLRNLQKNKLFIFINVVGMGIAIGCCIVSYLAIQYDRTFDANHANRESIYRVSAVREFEGTLTRFGHAPMPMRALIDKTIDDVELSSRYYESHSNFKRDDELFESNLSYVDSDFFHMFSFDFISGNANDLEDKNSLFINETMAIRLFGDATNALNKTVTQVVGNDQKEVRIAGIFRDQPMNSSFFKRNGASFMNFDNFKDEFPTMAERSWKESSALFVRLAKPNRLNVVVQQLQGAVGDNNAAREDFKVKEFVLDPFATMAHRDRDENVLANTWAAPPASAVIGSMIMSVMILLIACFNLTNTAVAISSQRIKEIGIRKVMGSRRKQLIVQFVGETTFICFLSVCVGLALSDFLIEGWNSMTNNHIRLTPSLMNSWTFAGFIAAIVLGTGILAGGYPAFYISKFEPVSILKGKTKFGGTNYFTRILLGLQFAISLITIVSSIGFYQNANFQRTYDLGFDVRGSIITWINSEAEYETYKNALLQNPDIISVAGAQRSIFSNPLHEAVKHESRQVEVDIIEVGDGYLNTLNLSLIKGRDFIKDSESDRNESVIITEKMARMFGWHDAIGKEIIWRDTMKLYVVGVTKDIYTRGLWHEMEPMMIRYTAPENYTQLIVSTKEHTAGAVNVFMNEQWSKVFPNRLYNGYMFSTSLDQVDRLNMSIVYGYGFLGLVAMILSATGLFTLVSLNIVKRMKEIGIRKILGASVSSITGVINREFIIILSIASVAGCYAGSMWSSVIMGTIWKYYQGVNVMTFVIAVTTIFTVAFITIGYKIISVANMNPVKTLRDE